MREALSKTRTKNFRTNNHDMNNIIKFENLETRECGTEVLQFDIISGFIHREDWA